MTTDCVCGHRRSHHGRRCCAQHDHCQWDGCGCPHYAQAVERTDETEMARLRRVEKYAAEVMAALDQHGASIVAHLLDNDENSGERLRRALRGDPA